LAAELLQEHEGEIEGLTLVPSDGGRFEVQVDGRLIYSKLETGRHAEPGEVMRLLEEVLGQ
jgi:selenoprotein W-related protein